MEVDPPIKRVSLGFCKPSLRGIARTQPEKSWYVERMLSRHFELAMSDEPDFLFYGDAGSGEHLDYPSRTIRIFITGENVLPDWSHADFALTHQRIYSDRHWRVPLHRHWYDTTCTVPMRDFELVRMRVTRFCNFVYSNERAAERIAFFDLLNEYKKVHAGGKVRNNIGYRVDDKLAFIAESKFTIAFENESQSGYATEKLIQPLLHGSIPIYWGDPSADLDFNPECFINVHRFPSFQAVVEEVKRIDNDDQLWEKYVRAPIFRDGRLPIELSDDSIVAFFERIFLEKRPRIPASVKVRQRLAYQLRSSHAANRFRRLAARVSDRISSLRYGPEGLT